MYASIAGGEMLPPQAPGTILNTEIPHGQDDGLGQPDIVNVISKCGIELMRFGCSLCCDRCAVTLPALLLCPRCPRFQTPLCPQDIRRRLTWIFALSVVIAAGSPCLLPCSVLVCARSEHQSWDPAPVKLSARPLKLYVSGIRVVSPSSRTLSAPLYRCSLCFD